jgi:hypothetical protein
MSYECIIRSLYGDICRDPDSGEGGLTPTANDFHIPYFQRTPREELKAKVGGAIDRCVQITYKGTQGVKPFISGGKIRHQDQILISVGYFAGDHHDETNIIMHADDKMLENFLVKPSNYPSCSGTCVEKIDVVNSNVVKLGKEQYILELLLAVQTTS